MNSTTPSDMIHSPKTYTPGYAGAKLGLIAFGLALFLLGLAQLWVPLKLLCVGTRVLAEASTVTKTKKGVEDRILTDDLQIQSVLEPRDRSFVFWNEVHFNADGREIRTRAPIGSQLKPLYPLLDEDGLPTTVLAYYDAAHPETVVFPTLISTWFAPGVLFLIGLLSMVIGSVLLYWANKPIDVPILPSATPVPTPPDPSPTIPQSPDSPAKSS